MMWILLVQARHFGAGNIKVLPEFENMLQSVQRKQLTIEYSECPCALWSQSILRLGKRKAEEGITPAEPAGGGGGGGGTGSDSNKKQKGTEDWHPLLKQAFEPALEKAGHPRFYKIWNMLNIDSVPGLDKRKHYCLPYLVKNTCNHGAQCRRCHVIKDEKDARCIIAAFKPFLDNPEALKQG